MSGGDWLDTALDLLTMVGLGVITLLSRSFFMLPEREWRLPSLLQRGLRYAPLAALAAVVAPELLMRDGHFLTTWADARLPAAAVGMAVYFWRRSILFTIVAGMLVYLPLHIGLGW
ncbi:AzlD domain-containing protein [Xylophilus rhododendri]|uniref:AzlD domain-containing protein n=1 Tax=Xylophilus rhododendri TaxID=2697032 RepID=A0A857J457_9BURK|nr:AzlD domain-containing protein [Xylophilus rhododendri]QHI98730.1 AzlD domain-containing protein [Xylophilus rhododendri]